MTQQEQFGGQWTQDKLARLKGYLHAYMQIFKRLPQYETVYVDAFAGTGTIPVKKATLEQRTDEDTDERDVEIFLSGSVRIALDVDPPFARYLFIEQNRKKAQELEKLKTVYSHQADRIEIKHAEANQFLLEWCQMTDWSKTRAVMFLDPFGMQVEWKLLEAIAATKAIDLWLLVPLGMGVNRMLTQTDLPPKAWQDRLTKFFGTDEWQVQFYRSPQQGNLFGDGPTQEKVANYDALASYFVGRLKKIFNGGVAPNPLTQRNSKNSPLFLLCFAAGNRYAPTAVKIAKDLLAKRPRE